MGKCYIVATPIGNLGDISYRAVEILNSVDLILAEDTRHSKRLLDHYSIEKPLLSYRDQIHERILGDILAALNASSDIALISDAGTPLISDPGFKLVRDLRSAGVEILSVPGASSLTAAVSISGLPTDRISFLGFLPKKTAARQKLLSEYMMTEATIVLFESPYRVEKLLEEICAIDGNRVVVICKDLTKLYEKVVTGIADEISSQFKGKKLKGEYVVCIGKADFKL